MNVLSFSFPSPPVPHQHQPLRYTQERRFSIINRKEFLIDPFFRQPSPPYTDTWPIITRKHGRQKTASWGRDGDSQAAVNVLPPLIRDLIINKKIVIADGRAVMHKRRIFPSPELLSATPTAPNETSHTLLLPEPSWLSL